MENFDKTDQNNINENFFGHFRYVEAKLKALSDYLNVHYYKDEKGEIIVKERKTK